MPPQRMHIICSHHVYGAKYGRREYDRIDTIAKICTVLIFATWIVVGGTTILFGRPLLSMYSSDPKVIRWHGAYENHDGCVFCMWCNERISGLTRAMAFRAAYAQHFDRCMYYENSLACYHFRLVSYTCSAVFMLPDYLGIGRTWSGCDLLLCPQANPQAGHLWSTISSNLQRIK